MKKQTAVEWLVQELSKNGYLNTLDIDQAIEMEKQQIIDAANLDKRYYKDAEDYYNHTFKATLPISDDEYKKVIKALYPKDNSRAFKSE